ncbi:hypothetical protein NA78x_005807 [Anatilimnocola sp. NA78]|uniref:hypothetical protein n=1 Tax=Anatilimnocola sp. NA78 TaxID=3415683 RepID=UPI003CE57FD3
MPIEFRCPNCDQQLRVPDAAAGKNAKCPKCASIVAVPGTAAAAPPPAFPPESKPTPSISPDRPFGAPPSRDAFSTPQSTGSFGQAPSNNPFGSTPPPTNPFGGGGAPPNNPFGGGGGSNPFAGDPKGPNISANPYASPASFTEAPKPLNSQGVGHQVVEIGAIMNHAMTVWQNNLGILVGTFFVAGLLSNIVNWISQGVQFALQVNKAPDELIITSIVIFTIIGYCVQIFLGIGQTTVCLKLARYQPAEFSDLFSGGDRFFPVLGGVILATLACIVGFALLVVTLIFLLLAFWPFYYLLVDRKTTVLDSFSLAYSIAEGNRLTTFVLWLLGIGIALLGCLACGIGLLFAVPLISMLWATAYLMMSGQIPINPAYMQQQQPQPSYS